MPIANIHPDHLEPGTCRRGLQIGETRGCGRPVRLQQWKQFRRDAEGTLDLDRLERDEHRCIGWTGEATCLSGDGESARGIPKWQAAGPIYQPQGAASFLRIMRDVERPGAAFARDDVGGLLVHARQGGRFAAEIRCQLGQLPDGMHVPGHGDAQQWPQHVRSRGSDLIDVSVRRLPRQSGGPQHDFLDGAVAVACRITKTAFHQSCEVSFHVKLFGCPDRVTSARLRTGFQ